MYLFVCLLLGLALLPLLSRRTLRRYGLGCNARDEDGVWRPVVGIFLLIVRPPAWGGGTMSHARATGPAPTAPTALNTALTARTARTALTVLTALTVCEFMGLSQESTRFAREPLDVVTNVTIISFATPRNCNADHDLALTVVDFHKVGLAQCHAAHMFALRDHTLLCVLAHVRSLSQRGRCIHAAHRVHQRQTISS